MRGIHSQMAFMVKSFFFVFIGAMLGPPWTLVAFGGALGFVLYAGSIDFRRLGVEPEEVVERVGQVLDALDELAPECPVLLLGLVSQRDLKIPGRDRLARTNAELGRAVASGYQ